MLSRVEAINRQNEATQQLLERQAANAACRKKFDALSCLCCGTITGGGIGMIPIALGAPNWVMIIGGAGGAATAAVIATCCYFKNRES